MLNSSLIYPSSSEKSGKTALIYSVWSFPIDKIYLLLFIAKYILSIVLCVLAKDWSRTFHGLIIDPSYLLTLSPYPTTGKDSIKSNWLLQNYKPSKKSYYWKTYFWFCNVNIDTYCLLGSFESLVFLKTYENYFLISIKSFKVMPFNARAFWWYFPVIVPIPNLLAASNSFNWPIPTPFPIIAN